MLTSPKTQHPVISWQYSCFHWEGSWSCHSHDAHVHANQCCSEMYASPAEGFQQQSWRYYQSTAPFRYILSALTLCWRNDNRAAASRKDAPTFNLHIKALVKHLCMCVYVHVCFTCTEPFLWSLHSELFLAFHHSASSQRKNSYCFPFFLLEKYYNRSSIIRASTYEKCSSRSARPWERELWCHLSSCRFALKDLPVNGRLGSLSWQSAPQLQMRQLWQASIHMAWTQPSVLPLFGILGLNGNTSKS